ncbi:MAG: AbrB/MazE/SpoVT family DNA-binding domain-containing protein [Clostridia bacterium]|jgi:AbrB family looped-hinge helix DNA binding protein
MELAKITSKGQITIPIDIRKKLGVKDGDKVLFFEEKGRIYIMNSSMEAIKKVQYAFTGEAERIGLTDEQAVVDMVSEIRHKKIDK